MKLNHEKYFIENENNLIVMPWYKKEVDGYFTKNREIKLNKI